VFFRFFFFFFFFFCPDHSVIYLEDRDMIVHIMTVFRDCARNN